MRDGILVGFLIFLLIWLGPTIAFAFWMRNAQLRYIRLYKDHHPDSLIPDIRREPLFSWRLDDVSVAKQILSNYFEEQENPVLEDARLVVSRRRKIMFGYMFSVPVVFFILATVFHW